LGILSAAQLVLTDLLTNGFFGLLQLFPRDQLGSQLSLPITYVVLVIFNRYFALNLLRHFLRSKNQKLLLIGKPSEVSKVESLLSKAKLFGMETVGLLTEAEAGEVPFGIRKLGDRRTWNASSKTRQKLGISSYACLLFAGSP